MIATLQSGYQPWNLPWITEFWDGSIGIHTDTGVDAWTGIKLGQVLAQATGGAQPAWAAGVLTFDGTDDFLKVTAGFTLNQPASFFWAMQSVTQTANDRVMDGHTADTAGVIQAGSDIYQLRAGVVEVDTTVTLADAVWTVGCFVFNSTASFKGFGLGAGATVDAGTNNAGGLTLGARGNNASFSNIKIMGGGYANTALTAAQRTQTIQAMARRYAITL